MTVTIKVVAALRAPDPAIGNENIGTIPALGRLRRGTERDGAKWAKIADWRPPMKDDQWRPKDGYPCSTPEQTKRADRDVDDFRGIDD